jgi:sugar phosphate isomerase/epimerase
MRRLLSTLVFLALALPAGAADVFDPGNRVAWCVVPFDSKKRGPTERVELLKRLGFTKYAYDWRAEHLPTFDAEVGLLKKAGITLQGVWFPAGVGKDGEELLRVLKAHEVKTELWVMLPQPNAKLSQDEKVKTTAELVAKLAQRVAKDGHKVGLYNHGGWTGEPDNLIAVVKACGEKNVGVVYNLHHGHDHFGKFADHLKAMLPHLLCLNLNGMRKGGDKDGLKILCLGEGDDDAKLLKVIKDSGYAGPVGILGHTDHDVEDRLADNLNGLDCLLRNDGYTPLYRTSAGFGLKVRFDSAKGAFSVTTMQREGMPAEGAKLLTVFVAKPGLTPKDYAQAQPVSGTTERPAWNEARFTPRFPPQPGTTYRVFFEKQTAEFRIPNLPNPNTTVTAVYPTADVLPENTLRMYLHFSDPMKKGDVYRHIKLRKEDGTEVKEPFLQLDEELWSPDGKRFTLLFYPGRVKRGLVPREEEGPILEEGKKYTLTIAKEWQNEAGFPLKEEFKKAFTAAKPDDAAIDPEKWAITPPKNQARRIQPLFVDFPKPLDHALATRMIWVMDAAGQKLDVPLSLHSNDTQLQVGEFDKPWKEGKYKLVIDTRLEDVCGNRVGRPFEVDVLKPVTKTIEAKTVEIPFEVK